MSKSAADRKKRCRRLPSLSNRQGIGNTLFREMSCSEGVTQGRCRLRRVRRDSLVESAPGAVKRIVFREKIRVTAL